ncbi:nucleotidyltransferase [Aulosira sp. FACHB-615]|uniref:nucleotidyltransferase n=1 Tax=Aulosira sp. FACHB-615 TaxID=2692777 RepID=UPI001688B74D|nr:nucleotidyltransferase [Aulosira sp. FACHB-615]MBD2491978.1 nucleotidyltransferase [Aulosira sp. FACHB-615]
MVKTVNEAFELFLRDYVNLDPDETKSARRGRDWLVQQIRLFPDKDINFPKLYSEKDIFFGSFARRTKKRELDDIDIMIALHADGSQYQEYGDRIEIYVPDSAYELNLLCYENTNKLNSRKVINKFISLLSQVPQYSSAEIKRNMEAAVLKLKSYPWSFDIVPCFFTIKNILDKDYYLIPDGMGDWKKTDPRIDRSRVNEINQSHDGNVLNTIRIMKYWNKRVTMPSMPSYLIENMILDFYSTQTYSKASKYVDLEIPKVLEYIQKNIYCSVNDPKGIQGNINTLTPEEKTKIFIRACLDEMKALEARQLDDELKYEASISKWQDFFGFDFPIYS